MSYENCVQVVHVGFIMEKKNVSLNWFTYCDIHLCENMENFRWK